MGQDATLEMLLELALDEVGQAPGSFGRPLVGQERVQMFAAHRPVSWASREAAIARRRVFRGTLRRCVLAPPLLDRIGDGSSQTASSLRAVASTPVAGASPIGGSSHHFHNLPSLLAERTEARRCWLSSAGRPAVPSLPVRAGRVMVGRHAKQYGRTPMLVAHISPAPVTLTEPPSGPRPALRQITSAPSPPPRLLDRVRQALQTRHYSRRTEKAYVGWIRRYILFHGKRHPAEMGAPEVTQFLTSLAVDRRVAASTQNQALGALLFLYREVLDQNLPWLDDLVRARRPHHLPVVMTRDEVRAVLQHLEGIPTPPGAALLWRRPAPARRRAPPGPGRRLRGEPDRRPGRQGRQGSGHHAPCHREGRHRTTSGGGPAPARGRSPGRSRLGGAAGGSTRTPAVSGAGSGSFRPRGSISTARRGNGAAITCTSPSPNAR